MYWNSVLVVPAPFGYGLIETWDVLKYVFAILCQLYPVWLIETWDVLKSPSSTDSVLKSPWLIETWDVLKYRYGERNV